MKGMPEIGDRVRCNAFTTGVVRYVERKSNGTRVAAVMTGTRYNGEEVVEWFKVADLIPLPRWVKVGGREAVVDDCDDV